jgi:hypothetical protein
MRSVIVKCGRETTIILRSFQQQFYLKLLAKFLHTPAEVNMILITVST